MRVAVMMKRWWRRMMMIWMVMMTCLELITESFCQSTLINENESHFLLILKSCQRLKMPHIILKWSHFLSGKSPGIDQLQSIVPFYTCHAKILGKKHCKARLNNKSTKRWKKSINSSLSNYFLFNRLVISCRINTCRVFYLEIHSACY